MSHAEDASKAHRAFRQAQDNAAQLQDDALSPEGLREKRAKLRDAAREQWFADRKQLQEEADRSLHAARQAAKKARPQIDRAEMAARWEQLRPLLESGRSIVQVLSRTDAAGVSAIQEYAPTFLEARTDPANELEPVDVRRLCDDRLIEMGGSVAEAVSNERGAAGDFAKASVYNTASPHQSELSIAVAAQHAE